MSLKLQVKLVPLCFFTDHLKYINENKTPSMNSRYVKFSENLIFLTTDTQGVGYVSFFGKFCLRTIHISKRVFYLLRLFHEAFRIF